MMMSNLTVDVTASNSKQPNILAPDVEETKTVRVSHCRISSYSNKIRSVHFLIITDRLNGDAAVHLKSSHFW